MDETPQARINTALAAIWQRQQPQVSQRIELLEQAAAAIPLSEARQQEAASIAHKLAGMLGMFGFTEGTEIARELEQHLDQPNPEAATLSRLAQQLRASVFP